MTSPTEHGVVGLATRLRDTAFKQTLAELEVGDEVEVEEPKGSFLLPEDTSASYVFVAGGIGITVFRSMLRYIADEGLPYDVTLVYSNRDRESSPFLDELEELEARIEGLRRRADDDRRSRPGTANRARIDEAMLRDHLGEPRRLHVPASPARPRWRRRSRRTLHDGGRRRRRVCWRTASAATEPSGMRDLACSAIGACWCRLTQFGTI